MLPPSVGLNAGLTHVYLVESDFFRAGGVRDVFETCSQWASEELFLVNAPGEVRPV